jgi:tetratricopeptide (TPR) repeat protein
VLPPDDPSPGYKSTWMDRAGPDAGITLRAARYALVVFPLSLALWGTVVTQKLGIGGLKALLLTLVAAVVTTVIVFRTSLASANAAGAVARAFTMPSGNSTPYEEQFSYQESLAARGDVAGALESYEAVIAERPEATAPRLKAAELYARRGGNPRRAAALFREVRELRDASPRDALYASSRLVDLYDGPLDEPGRALVELRRLVELHPNTDVAAGARVAIARIKAQRASEQGDG